MGDTFLTHEGCGGQIGIDVSSGIKLMAFAFSITSDGIQRPVLDVDVCNSRTVEPQYQCRRCGNQFHTAAEIENNATAMCQVCGKEKLISRSFVHKYVTCICRDCLDIFAEFHKGHDVPPRYREWAQVYNIGERPKLTPLSKILFTPVRV